MNKYELAKQELADLIGSEYTDFDAFSLIVEYELNVEWYTDGVDVCDSLDYYGNKRIHTHMFIDHNESRSSAVYYAVLCTVTSMLHEKKHRQQQLEAL